MITLDEAPKSAAAPAPVAEEGSSLWRDAWHRLLKNKLALAGAVVIILLTLLCVFAGVIAPSPNLQDLSRYASPPGWAHWFGTDTLGRDLFARVLFGGRISLAVGVVATAVALCIGVVYGTVAGFLGGTVDAVMMRVVDILYALPFTIFVILLTVFFGSNLILLFAAIGAVEWLTMARIVRGQVRSLRKMEFIEAAEALGISKRRIIFRHMIPNVLGPIIVYTTLTIPSVMLLEAFLSFLGLGVQPPNASWGVLIGEGAKDMEEFPWLLIFPGIALSVTLFSFNFLGDGLRDALDPRASKD
jgi:oligopeptide transport system permease protein